MLTVQIAAFSLVLFGDGDCLTAMMAIALVLFGDGDGDGDHIQ